jgi:hypothetical protein
MNDSIITQYADAHKLVSNGLGLSTIDEENEQLYDDSSFGRYRVPVKRVRQGYVELLACDPKSAESVWLLPTRQPRHRRFATGSTPSVEITTTS